MGIMELIILACAVLCVTGGAIMALLINLVLPSHYTDEKLADESPFQQDGEGSYTGDEQKAMAAGRITGSIKTYPFLVSVSGKPYKDRSMTLFRCAGFIVEGHGLTVFTGPACALDRFTVIVVRTNSDYFWADGTPYQVGSNDWKKDNWVTVHVSGTSPGDGSDQRSGRGRRDTRNRSRKGHRGKGRKPKEKPADILAKLDLFVPDVESEHFVAGWGSEMRPNKDILTKSPFFLETWHFNKDKGCKNAPDYCYSYFHDITVTADEIESMDGHLQCCYEGFLYKDKSDVQDLVFGDQNGKPLFYKSYQEHYVIVGMQHDIAFPKNKITRFYTVFDASGVDGKGGLEKEEGEVRESEDGVTGVGEERSLRNKNKKNRDQHRESRQSTGNAMPLYRTYNVKRYFSNWFRYRQFEEGIQQGNATDKVEDKEITEEKDGTTAEEEETNEQKSTTTAKIKIIEGKEEVTQEIEETTEEEKGGTEDKKDTTQVKDEIAEENKEITGEKEGTTEANRKRRIIEQSNQFPGKSSYGWSKAGRKNFGRLLDKYAMQELLLKATTNNDEANIEKQSGITVDAMDISFEAADKRLLTVMQQNATQNDTTGNISQRYDETLPNVFKTGIHYSIIQSNERYVNGSSKLNERNDNKREIERRNGGSTKG